MATFNKFDVFVQDLGRKVHNLNADTLVIALCSAAPVAGDVNLASLSAKVIAYTNLTGNGTSPGGRGNVGAYAHTTGTGKLTLTDNILTASGAVATFRYVVLYNDTATNDELIAWWDYGSNVTLANGETFTVDFDGSLGVLTIA